MVVKIADNVASIAQSGHYSYTSPDGQFIEVHYIADEAGFQPIGAHIPTAPPQPAYVSKMLAKLRSG